MRIQRAQNPRLRRRTLLIQCEGQETEPNYLEGFCKACGVRQRIKVKVKAGKGQNAAVTVRDAITEGNRRVQGQKAYDEVWCVLDVEHAAHENSLNKAVALAKEHKIHLFLSNPSFEVWLLAHFERTKRDFADCGAVESYLSDKYWNKKFGCEYEKGDPNLYAKLADLQEIAIANARYVLEVFYENKPCRNSNASTEVYHLVTMLMPE